MGRSLRVTHALPASPARTVEVMTDPGYLRARGEKYGGDGAPEVSVDGDTTVVRSPRLLPMEHVPGALKGFVPNGGRLTQVDRWPADRSAPVHGSWAIDGAGPATVKGAFLVEEAPGGCQLTATGEVSVPIPLVGGKAEKLIVDNIQQLLGSELRFLERWLGAPANE